MILPEFAAADILAARQNLLPPGRAWSRDADSVQARFLATLAPTSVRVCARGLDLLADAFPAGTEELLPEWEQSLGLPDPCAGASPTIEARRAQVVGRLVGLGGQSVPYYIAVAASLGYAITITEYAPFRFGMAFGNPLNGEAWAYAWQVNAPQFTIDYFQFGASAFGEPFASWGNAVLQCELMRLKPAHTVLNFSYH